MISRALLYVVAKEETPQMPISKGLDKWSIINQTMEFYDAVKNTEEAL